MANLDSLPPDQRAVLALVLQRGHTFDDIAGLLSIDRAAVRERALNAMDALGPETEVDSARRALITDYLLGQLPARVADTVREGLASSGSQRAWARVLASDLAPLASKPLPEIPSGRSRRSARSGSVPAQEASGSASPETPVTRKSPRRTPQPVAASPSGDSPASDESSGGRGGDARRSSRRGGAILLGLGLLIAIVAVVVIIASSGGSSSHPSAGATTTSGASTSAAGSSTSSTTSATSSAKPIAQVNLSSPSGNSKIGGVAIVVRQGATEGLVIRAQGVPANTGHDAYAVWLSNGVGDEHILGFVNPGVTANGVLQTAGPLPSNASHFKQLLVTRESQAKPTAHGTIVLQGAISLTG